jgi:hypothetical protein
MNRPIRRAIFVNLGVLALYIAWAVLQPDEKLKPELATAFASPGPKVSDATIGLTGLEAPMGVDFMQHGRLMLAAMQAGEDWPTATKRLNNGKPVLEFKWRDNIDCHMFSKHEDVPQVVRDNCASVEQTEAFLRDNAELMRRYRLIQKMPVTADGVNFKAQAAINLGKMNMVDIVNDLRLGRTEQAYEKWRNNHIHQTRMVSYGGGWVMLAINLVNEGLSMGSLNLLLEQAPQLMETHHDELLALLKPRDLTYYNLGGVMLGENKFLEQQIAEKGLGRFIRVNRLRNRFDDYSHELVDVAAKQPATVVAATAEVRKRHLELRTTDIIDPINSITWRLAMNEYIKGGQLIESMLAKEAQRRLFTLKVMMAKSKIADADVDAFLKAAPIELRSPSNGAAFTWNAAKRSLGYDIPKKVGVVEVFL